MYFDDTGNGFGSKRKRARIAYMKNTIKYKDMYAATIQANM